MKRLFLMALMLILISSFICNGCAKSTPTISSVPSTSQGTTTTATTPKQTTTVPQNGGALKVLLAPGIVSIGVPGTEGTIADFSVSRCSIESLLNLDEKGNITPWLAASWQYSTDYKSLTFTLRKGVKFHDDTDFNATTAKYCLDLFKKRPRTELSSVTSVDIVDDYTIRLNLSRFDPGLLLNLTSIAGKMISPTSLQALGEDASKTHPVGTGPFKFVSYQTSVSVKFEKFANYWQTGKPYLDSIEWDLIADPVTRLMSFKTGQGDVVSGISGQDAADLKTAGYTINRTPSNVTGLAGDSAHATSPFADIKVRQAIAYALDNAAIAKAAGFGFYDPTNQFTAPSGPYYNSAVVGYPFNTQKAKDLLSQAGYSAGLNTKITFASADADIFTAIQGYLKAVGINADLDPADPARWSQVRTTGWTNQLVSYLPSFSFGIDVGTSIGGSMSDNATFYPSNTLLIPADYQAKFLQASNETDSKKRQTMFQDLMKMIIDQYCIGIPIFVRSSLAALSPKVHDMNLNVISGSNYNPENAWISK